MAVKLAFKVDTSDPSPQGARRNGRTRGSQNANCKRVCRRNGKSMQAPILHSLTVHTLQTTRGGSGAHAAGAAIMQKKVGVSADWWWRNGHSRVT
jgi:hypothetical protein